MWFQWMTCTSRNSCKIYLNLQEWHNWLLSITLVTRHPSPSMDGEMVMWPHVTYLLMYDTKNLLTLLQYTRSRYAWKSTSLERQNLLTIFQRFFSTWGASMTILFLVMLKFCAFGMEMQLQLESTAKIQLKKNTSFTITNVHSGLETELHSKQSTHLSFWWDFIKMQKKKRSPPCTPCRAKKPLQCYRSQARERESRRAAVCFDGPNPINGAFYWWILRSCGTVFTHSAAWLCVCVCQGLGGGRAAMATR